MTLAYHFLFYMVIFGILVLSLNLVVGFGGLLNLAHAAFFAVGCYSYALVQLLLVNDFVLASAVALLVSGVLGALIAWPGAGSRENGYLLITLAFQLLFARIVVAWYSPEAPVGTFANPLNGPYGITSLQPLTILGQQLDIGPAMLVLFLITAGIIASLHFLLTSGAWGQQLEATRDDQVAAESLGINVDIERVKASAIAAGMSAVAGVLYASYARSVDPSIASLNQSILWLAMLVIGGIGNQAGPWIGAACLLLLPELLRDLPFSPEDAANLERLSYGLILLLILHLRPKGIAGKYSMR